MMHIMTASRFSTKAFTLIKGLILASLVAGNTAYAKEKPLWQFGVGVGGLNQSYYTGTKQTRSFLFPVILPIYRGEVFKSDDRGARAEVFKNDKLKLDISLDFNLSIDSDDVDLRRGMPDIANNLQIGPSLEWTLQQSKNHLWKVNFPLRVNIGIDSDGADLDGTTFSPNLEFNQNFRVKDIPWRFGASIGPQFGSSAYHDVYYSVDDEFATNTRAAFQSDGGYTGFRTQVSVVNRNSDKHLFVLFLRYENISGAVFEDSPLVETDDNLIVGFIYNYYLFNSKTLVTR